MLDFEAVHKESSQAKTECFSAHKLRPKKVEDQRTAQRHVAALQKKVEAWLERPNPRFKKPKVASALPGV